MSYNLVQSFTIVVVYCYLLSHILSDPAIQPSLVILFNILFLFTIAIHLLQLIGFLSMASPRVLIEWTLTMMSSKNYMHFSFCVQTQAFVLSKVECSYRCYGMVLNRIQINFIAFLDPDSIPIHVHYCSGRSPFELIGASCRKPTLHAASKASVMIEVV